MAEGQAEYISGLTAIDDHTLQVTIDAPKPYFILKLTYPTGSVVDKVNVEGGEDWYRQPMASGPYYFLSPNGNPIHSIIYEADPDYYLGKPSIPYVVLQLYPGEDLRLYETGEIDISPGVSPYSVDRFLDPSEPMHAELLQGVDLCTGYVVFDATQPPFDNVNVSRAFSMAFDRQRYIDVVLRGQACLPSDRIPGIAWIQLCNRGPAI